MNNSLSANEERSGVDKTRIQVERKTEQQQ
jgi:hypothetical protein